jgi:anti-sigma regulatory factor (Ser/Thr protein kinase)
VDWGDGTVEPGTITGDGLGNFAVVGTHYYLEDGKVPLVTITDQGGLHEAGTAEQPDLVRKLAGEQSPRGWGLFLIRNMVDAMDVTTDGTRHTVRLTMATTIPADEGATRENHL